MAIERQAQLEQLDGLTLDEIRDYRELDYNVGRIVFPAVARYLLREDLSSEDSALVHSVYRDFVFGGVMILRAFLALIDKDRPDAMVFVNGKLCGPPSAGRLFADRSGGHGSYEDIGTRFIGRTWVFSSPEAVMDLDFNLPWKTYKEQALTDAEGDRLDAALSRRRRPGLFYRHMEQERSRIEEELGIVAEQRPIALFTNVAWTRQLCKRTLASRVFEIGC